MKYSISAMVVYFDTVEADTLEEALDKFVDDCPYDVDGNTIEWEEIEDD